MNPNLLSLKDFLKVPIDCIHIGVSKISSNIFMKTTYEIYVNVCCEEMKLFVECTVNKRYTEFQGFYDSLTIRYQNLNFPQFPSKFQIINKKEARKKFFDSLLKTVLVLAGAHPEIKKELLKLLYEFTFGSSGAVVANIAKDKPKSFESNTHRSMIISSDNHSNLAQSMISLEPTRKVSTQTLIEESFSDVRSSSGDPQNLNSSQKKNQPPIVNDTALIASIFQTQEEETNKDGWQVDFKFTGMKFTKAFVKFSDDCIQIYDSIVSNNYFMCMPLYQVKFHIARVSGNKKKFIQIEEIIEANEFLHFRKVKDFTMGDFISEIHFVLYHAYDTSELTIKFCNETNDLNRIIKFHKYLDMCSNMTKTNSRVIQSIDETNSYIYGKLYLELSGISIPNFEGNVFAVIHFNPYVLKSKAVINLEKFNFKQTFIIPIHNRFGVLKIEIFNKINQGLFHKRVVEEKLCEHMIIVPEVLNNFFLPTKAVETKLEIPKNIKPSTTSNTNVTSSSATQATLYYKLKNFSSILAFATKNRNKHVLEDMYLYRSEEEISIKNLLKRMKKIIYVIKEFKEYYKNVFRFKYPIHSTIVIMIATLYFLFCDIKYWLAHLICLFTFVIFFYSRFYKVYLSNYSNKYIFSFRNPYDFDSFVITKIDIETDEVRGDKYLVEDKEKKNIIKKIIDPIKNYKNIKRTYHEVLFKFTRFVSVLEKFKNLIFWTDPLLSFYFMLLLFAFFLIVYGIQFKYMMLFVIWKKSLNGITFYKRKYLNNLEIAIIILKHCHEEWFNETKTKLKSTEKINRDNIDNIMVYDDKFKIFIKEQLEKHADIVIKLEFINSVNKLGEIKEAIAKSKSLLKMKKESQLQCHIKGNKKIYKTPLDIEDIFVYFIHNIKSDYYISKYNLENQVPLNPTNATNNFSSISYTDLVQENISINK